MPLPQIDLDDRKFDQLVAEGRALIPRYFPTWTDYNESDPGITLLELFAFLIEALIYQINRIPNRSFERFVRLVGITRGPDEPIERTLRRALEAGKEQYRAVTQANFEALALQVNSRDVGRTKAVIESPPGEVFVTVESALSTILTVSAFNSSMYGLRRGAAVSVTGSPVHTTLAADVPPNQTSTRLMVADASFAASLRIGTELRILVQPSAFPLDQWVELVVVPKTNPRATAAESLELRQQVFEFLTARRLIATRVKVVPPDYTTVDIAVTVVRDATGRLSSDTVAGIVHDAVRTFLDPMRGGFDGNGWPFGRSLYRSELDRLIESLDGVDHIQELWMNGDQNIAAADLDTALSLVDLGQLSVSVIDA